MWLLNASFAKISHHLIVCTSCAGGFIKGRAPGKLTGCERDLATNLPGCFHLLFSFSFIRKTKNAWLKNPTDSWHWPPLQNFDRDLGEISASFWPARLPRSRRDSRRDLGEILKSRRPKTRRDSLRDLDEIWKSRRPKTLRESRQDFK